MTKGYGICLNEWLEDDRIKTELRILIKVSSLTAEKGYCYASNDYFAEYFNTSTVTISKQLKKLESLEYLEIEYKMRGAQVEKRFLRLKKTLMGKENFNGTNKENFNRTIKENFKDNSISTNSISTNKKEDLKNPSLFPVKAEKKIEVDVDDLPENSADVFFKKLEQEFNLGIDVNCYIGKALNWMSGLPVKDKRRKKTMKGYVATMRKFMSSDKENGKLVMQIQDQAKKDNEYLEKMKNFLND